MSTKRWFSILFAVMLFSNCIFVKQGRAEEDSTTERLKNIGAELGGAFLGMGGIVYLTAGIDDGASTATVVLLPLGAGVGAYAAGQLIREEEGALAPLLGSITGAYTAVALGAVAHKVWPDTDRDVAITFLGAPVLAVAGYHIGRLIENNGESDELFSVSIFQMKF